MIQIIPAIDIIDGKCVRLTQGDYSNTTEYRGLPDELARRYADYGFSRLHLVDLSGAKAGKPENLRTLEKIANSVDNMVIEWGGGVKTDDDIRSCFDAGANCIVGGSIAVRKPEIFEGWLSRYGHEVIILGADAREGRVAVSGWLENTDVSISDLINRYLPLGLTQTIVTDISKDGMLLGPNYSLYADLQSEFPNILFTVSGGISSIDDIFKLESLGMKRVIVGKAIYEGCISLRDLQKFNI